ncbi:MAG: RluA family pseudouridine synthase [Bacillota bacterium]|nr:RluA family pseudouridine synthase [Bacillota bacterium]
MNNILTYRALNLDKKTKLRAYLKREKQISTRFLISAGREGRIKVNGKEEKLNYMLSEGDIIEIELQREETQDIDPVFMELDIIYEDKDILIINKPPFIVVHPTKNYQTNTLSNGIIYYFRQKGEDTIVRLVSRLDMNTSGLIVVAKNQFTHMAMARDKASFQKTYLAVVHNKMKEKEGLIDLPILKEEIGVKRIISPEGQESKTMYKVIEEYDNSSLIELRLLTGRTHQIRVHLSHFGCPIYGDDLYGEADEEYIKRQALHAVKIEFSHPRTLERMKFEATIPEDIKNLINKLRRP